MGERTADASTPDSRNGEVGALRVAVRADPARQVRLVQEVLNGLDRMLDASIEDRLAFVAARAADCLGAATSSVTRIREESLRPRVAEAAEGSAFGVTLDTADPAEQGALSAAGFGATVVAGGYDPDARRWLVELFGDEFAYETASFAAILFAFVQAALGFPRAVTPGFATA